MYEHIVGQTILTQSYTYTSGIRVVSIHLYALGNRTTDMKRVDKLNNHF